MFTGKRLHYFEQNLIFLRSEEVQAMVEKLEKEEEKLKKAENTIAVMTMLKDGTVPETISTSGESQGDNSIFS